MSEPWLPPTFVAVLPSIYPLWTKRCMDSWLFHDQTLIVDNTVDNLGVSASWNLGVEWMARRRASWLIVMSAACRFGEYGGADFVMDHLGGAGPDDLVLEAAHGIGWHLIAFRAEVFDRVGLFDENFYPAYFEDLDWGRRYRAAYEVEPPFWRKVSTDVAIAGFAHGVDLGGATGNNARSKGYYEAKWGGPVGSERFTFPFGDASKPINWWPRPE